MEHTFDFTDEDLANDVVSTSGKKRYATSEIIHTLVQSNPFQSK
jgi:hypothetical protein